MLLQCNYRKQVIVTRESRESLHSGALAKRLRSEVHFLSRGEDESPLGRVSHVRHSRRLLLDADGSDCCCARLQHFQLTVSLLFATLVVAARRVSELQRSALLLLRLQHAHVPLLLVAWLYVVDFVVVVVEYGVERVGGVIGLIDNESKRSAT